MTRDITEIVNNAGSHPVGSFPGQVGEDHVCILLGLFNGAATLGAQLDSLAAQSHDDWSLILSDDGSRDDWFGLVAAFSDDHAPGRTWITQGSQRGATGNFLSLACCAGPMVPYAAFCNQDDVWLPHKLARALAHLKSVADGVPAIYVSRTMICDRDLTRRKPSQMFKTPPSFENALVHRIGDGSTMVLNRAALDIVQDTAPKAVGVNSYDWWLYQLISGAGGIVIYDKTPTLLSRQHAPDRTGGTASLRRYGAQFRRVFQHQSCVRTQQNLAALNRVRRWLTDDARTTLHRFEEARRGPTLARLVALKRSGVARPTKGGTLALWLAVLLNRL